MIIALSNRKESKLIKKIVCVGAGSSSIIAALHLLDEGFKGELTLVGKPFGPAYETLAPYHILNVTAGNMSALVKDPLHFYHFASLLLDRPDLEKTAFVPRKVFRDYLQNLLDTLKNHGVKHQKDEAIAILAVNKGYTVYLKDGTTCDADCVILAIGNFPSFPLPGSEHLTANQYVDIPWDKNITTDLDPKARILFVGTGLTMVDGLATLNYHRHQGQVIALSRRGLLPLVRTMADPLPLSYDQLPHHSTRQLMRFLRNKAKEVWHNGEPWDRVIDGVRPFLQTLWQALPDIEKKRFLRHACVYWDIHRHRIPQESDEILQSFLRTKQLHVMAARLLRVQPKGQAVEVTFKRRGQNSTENMMVDRVVNCTGPVVDYTKVKSLLVQRLFAEGLARPHPLRLGFDATVDGKLIDKDGNIQDRLITLGSPLKGVLWESIAIPEIREEARKLAKMLIENRK